MAFLTIKPADSETVSLNQAMELVGVSRRTIYNWINSGKVDYMRTAGGSIRIIKATLWRISDRPAKKSNLSV